MFVKKMSTLLAPIRCASLLALPYLLQLSSHSWLSPSSWSMPVPMEAAAVITKTGEVGDMGEVGGSSTSLTFGSGLGPTIGGPPTAR